MEAFINRIHPLLRISILASVIMGLVYAYHNYKVSEEIRDIQPFHAIEIGGLMNVYLQKGEVEQLRVKADDHILPKIKTFVEDGVLKIYTEGVIRGERIKDAFVTYVQLDSLHAAGVGTLTSRGVLPLDSFRLRASTAAEVRLQIQGQSLDLQMHDNANVQLAGAVQSFNCHLAHHGDLMAYNFKANKANIQLHTGPQSPGIARVHVLDSLWAEVQGPRYLYYLGEPRFVEKNAEGEGKVLKK
ncbi:MAG: DUF2807 domain-containing protein [Saprospiraceae bacterium]|nr:DUF2807 domain-containing protein [Saprospiraceae bacterium]